MVRYAAPVFLGAFLLFQVQPLIARYILPWFGGTPSVWTTCMLFFQVLLVLGYAYAHFLISRVGPRAQVAAHIGLLAVSILVLVVMTWAWGTPITPSMSWKPPDSTTPIARILLLLTVAVGLPYLVLATTSPLLQAWFSRTNPGVSPYRLYTLSNAGSLLALVSYPFVFEPALAQRAQAVGWAGGYVVFCLVCAYCAARVWQTAPATAAATAGAGAIATDEPAPTLGRRALWLGLPALASVLLLAVTNQLCQEVAVIPFLWVVPLSLYLISFIICFDNERWYQRGIWVPLMVVAIPVLMAILRKSDDVDIRLAIAVYSLVLFVCCMVCHGELVALKPSPRHLTAFYLAVSVGGALGGIVVGIIAPLVAHGFWELHLGLYAAWVVGVVVIDRNPETWPSKLLVRVAIVIMALSLTLPLIPRWKSGSGGGTGYHNLAVSRNFYGILRVVAESATDPNYNKHTLVHGRTIHGYQFQGQKERWLATTYYGTGSGVGLALLNHPRRVSLRPQDRALRIGAVGLGVGTIATYGRPGDYLRFYEINPQVAAYARDSGYFTYVTGSGARVDIALGDGRISLERELQRGSQQYDLMVLDAFSSDAIPAHLLTREAFELYLGHLRDPDGVLAVHVTNKALKLRPVVWKLADHFGLSTALIESGTDEREVTLDAEWMLLTRDPRFVRLPAIAAAASPRDPPSAIPLWTDDFHNLFQILK